MAYLGRGLDKISNIEVLDNITFDGSSSYSITKGSVAFTPNSAQSCLISIDGVVQATNFSVNSSTIDFGVAIPSTSVCNFFLHYGTGVMTVPSDGSVTTAKLGDGAVTSAKLSAGKVLQVVHASTNTETTIQSTTYADTTLSASITPSSTSSKVLILISQVGRLRLFSDAELNSEMRILRDSTVIYTKGITQSTRSGQGAVGANDAGSSSAIQYLDSPNTTSQITYKTQGKVDTTTPNNAGITFQVDSTNATNNGSSEITLMEISG
jgi:hypothetical protein